MRRERHDTALIAVLLCAGLTGCGPSVEGYVDDAEARREILGQCATLELDPSEDERCAMALEAEAIAAKQAVEGMFDDG